MNIPVIAFFNTLGVGKTSLVYHLAWMCAELGKKVLAVDLDPQANLTATFLNEERLEDVFENPGRTIYDFVRPLALGTGDSNAGEIEHIHDTLALIPGDPALSGFEEIISSAWPKCYAGEDRSFRVISAFWHVMQQAANNEQSEIILMDLAPNLGAINRAALISADYVVIPLSSDVHTLRGLHILGWTLSRWRKEWKDMRSRNESSDLALPAGEMRPVGYVVLQHAVRLDRPVKAYERRLQRIPETYHEQVLEEQQEKNISVQDDPYCLALLKNYRSLTPLAQEAHKPMFLLRPADGALGAHMQAVQDAHRDFRLLAQRILEATVTTMV